MFTGIVQCLGTLVATELAGDDVRLSFSAPTDVLQGARTGDSMCVSGVCLTMLNIDADRFSADASTETLALTTLGRLAEGDAVNLEPAVRASDRLGGHLVSGHIDGRARLVSQVDTGRARVLTFDVPGELSRYIATKGSVCIDGVSLTVNGVSGSRFEVCIIPHTWEVTTFGGLAPGVEVNIEVDIIARYLERLTGQDRDSE